MNFIFDKIKNKSVFLAIILIISASLNISVSYFVNSLEYKENMKKSYELLFERIEEFSIVDGQLIYEYQEKYYSNGDFAILFLTDSKEIYENNYILFQKEYLEIKIKGQSTAISYSDIFNNSDDIKEKIFVTLFDIFNIITLMNMSYTLFYTLLTIAILSMITLYYVNRTHGMLTYKNIWNITSLSLFISSFIIGVFSINFKFDFIYTFVFMVIFTSLIVFKATILNYRGK
ncbi:hypothetical protein BHF71_09820 [Vulcanibacillus modesticaldus]|uniref:DUF1189 domain-containing protein n=1 Tax=Vulcanibacillus modesticaldus TaxID=337097 RepID=A0A1D2YTY3_9BACI|nr:DUF1189 family protein [Vulcanibacillus modesticaldus]OEF99170.1 hypothetical protein BHF71_09820 [Vulcanibacillus modesticaldus]